MKLKDRMKTYNFWLSFASALYLLIHQIGKKFGFNVDESLYNEVITSICSVLVLFGIIVPQKVVKTFEEDIYEVSDENDETKQEIIDDESDEVDCENGTQESSNNLNQNNKTECTTNDLESENIMKVTQNEINKDN